MVVDFADTAVGDGPRTLEVSDGTLRRAAIAQAGSHTARVVVELAADAEFEVRADGNRVEVRIPKVRRGRAGAPACARRDPGRRRSGEGGVIADRVAGPVQSGGAAPAGPAHRTPARRAGKGRRREEGAGREARARRAAAARQGGAAPAGGGRSRRAQGRRCRAEARRSDETRSGSAPAPAPEALATNDPEKAARQNPPAATEPRDQEPAVAPARPTPGSDDGTPRRAGAPAGDSAGRAAPGDHAAGEGAGEGGDDAGGATSPASASARCAAAK